MLLGATVKLSVCILFLASFISSIQHHNDKIKSKEKGKKDSLHWHISKADEDEKDDNILSNQMEEPDLGDEVEDVNGTLTKTNNSNEMFTEYTQDIINTTFNNMITHSEEVTEQVRNDISVSRSKISPSVINEEKKESPVTLVNLTLLNVFNLLKYTDKEISPLSNALRKKLKKCQEHFRSELIEKGDDYRDEPEEEEELLENILCNMPIKKYKDSLNQRALGKLRKPWQGFESIQPSRPYVSLPSVIEEEKRKLLNSSNCDYDVLLDNLDLISEESSVEGSSSEDGECGTTSEASKSSTRSGKTTTASVKSRRTTKQLWASEPTSCRSSAKKNSKLTTKSKGKTVAVAKSKGRPLLPLVTKHPKTNLPKPLTVKYRPTTEKIKLAKFITKPVHKPVALTLTRKSKKMELPHKNVSTKKYEEKDYATGSLKNSSKLSRVFTTPIDEDNSDDEESYDVLAKDNREILNLGLKTNSNKIRHKMLTKKLKNKLTINNYNDGQYDDIYSSFF